MASFKEKDLSKGHQRKLEALRKSLGNKIANAAFTEWLATQPAKKVAQVDKNIQAMTDLVTPAVMDGSIRLPMMGFVVKRGRGRVIVTPVK
mgnify:FL=1